MRSVDMLRFSLFAFRSSLFAVCCVILSDERSEESKDPYTRQQTCVCRRLKPTPNQQKISGLNAGLKARTTRTVKFDFPTLHRCRAADCAGRYGDSAHPPSCRAPPCDLRPERFRPARSEERRVGKECRSRWSTY